MEERGPRGIREPGVVPAEEGSRPLWLECAMPAMSSQADSLSVAGKTILRRGDVSGNLGK